MIRCFLLLAFFFGLASRACAVTNQEIIAAVDRSDAYHWLMNDRGNPYSFKARAMRQRLPGFLEDLDRTKQADQKEALLAGLKTYERAILNFQIAQDLDKSDEERSHAREVALKQLGQGKNILSPITVPGRGNAKEFLFPNVESSEVGRKRAPVELLSAFFSASGHNGVGSNSEQAAAAFKNAQAIDPNNEDALRGGALAAYYQGQYQNAYDQAQQALVIDPSDKGAQSIAQLSISRGASPSAALDSAAATAAEHDPGPSNALDNATAPNGPSPGATAPTPVKFTPKTISASVESAKQASVSLGLGDLNAALAQATRAIELNNQNAQAYNYRASAQNGLGRYEEALADASAGLAIVPQSAPLLDSKAFALNQTGKFREALASADLALKINPKDAAAHANRSYALRGLGDKKGMLAELRQAAALDSRFKASLDSALQAPADSDVYFLFPGQARRISASANARPTQERGKNLWLLGLFAAGFLAAAGLYRLLRA